MRAQSECAASRLRRAASSELLPMVGRRGDVGTWPIRYAASGGPRKGAQVRRLTESKDPGRPCRTVSPNGVRAGERSGGFRSTLPLVVPS